MHKYAYAIFLYLKFKEGSLNKCS